MHLYHKQSINDGDKKEKDGCFPIKCECLGVVMSNDLMDCFVYLTEKYIAMMIGTNSM